MNINYIPLKKYLTLFTKDQQGLIKTFFETSEIYFDDYFLCTCLYVFFDIHHLLLLLLPMCKIYSNICITQSQIDDFFKQLNLQTTLYSDIEKVLEKSLITLPGYPYGAFSVKSFTNYFKSSIAFQTLLYQLRIILSDRSLTPRIYRNIVQRMKYHYYLAEERFLGFTRSNHNNNNNNNNKIPKPYNMNKRQSNNNIATPLNTPNVSPPSSPVPPIDNNNNNNNNNSNLNNNSSLPPTLPLSPTFNLIPSITVIQVANSNNNSFNNANKKSSGSTAGGVPINASNNNDISITLPNTPQTPTTPATQTPNTANTTNTANTANTTNGTTGEVYYQFPHSSPSSLRNSCDFYDVNSNASNGSKCRKEVVLPPSESFCQKMSRVLFSIEPPPDHADFLLEEDTFINGLDNMIYILKQQYGYSTRCNSIRDIVASGRQKSLNFSRNLMITMNNNKKGSSSLPNSPHTSRHTSLRYNTPNFKIQPLPEVAEN